MSFRFDRFATLYLFQPLRRNGARNNSSLPILMYHSLSEDAEIGRGRPYYLTTTAPSVFASHMQRLSDCGYRTVNVAEAVQLLHSGASTRGSVVITFDDGYSDFYRHAFPSLDRFNFTATVYLPTGYIGTSPLQFKGKECLTWSEVRELRKHGISFGSHTMTHPQLSTLDSASVKNEIVNSKHAIEDNLGEPVNGFAYPYAFPEQNARFVRTLREILADAGYQQGVSTRIGMANREDDCYFLRRLPMNSLDDIALFDAKLQGGYDWLHGLQFASKYVRSRVFSHA
jgi:peptidoglycan/xylan/chitin deacetylase (PgdA/CDA1 family)